MTAYLIVCRQTPVSDQAAMDRYKQMASSGKPSPDLSILAAYGQLTALEGPAPDGVVVLGFPSVAAARAWYDRPEYQAAVAERLKAAEFQSFIVEGLPAKPA